MPETHVIRIPRHLRSRSQLIAFLAHQLDAPAWFGRNWDALSDLLRETSEHATILFDLSASQLDPVTESRFLEVLALVGIEWWLPSRFNGLD